MAGAKAEVIARLKQGPATIEDLRPMCASRKAVVMMIYRLRDDGYEIDSKPPKSSGGAYTYVLRRLPGSLKPFRFPPLRNRPVANTG